MVPPRAYLLLGLAIRAVDAIRGVEDLFQVDFNTNDEGGCAYVGLGNMNQILQDCATLAQKGIDATNDYEAQAGTGTQAEAKRLLDAYFRISREPLSQLTQLGGIRGIYQKILTWLNNGGPLLGGTDNSKPYLFCNHGFLVKKNMGDDAWDNQGNTWKDGDTNVKISDIDEYQDEQENQADILNLDLDEIYPYWAVKHKSYIFDQSYGGAGSGVCSSGETRSSRGMTYDLPSPWIVLCPSGFGTRNDVLAVNYRALHSIPNDPITLAALQGARPGSLAGTQTIEDVAATAATLFHELFHLVIGLKSGQTVPPGLDDEVYDLTNILALTYNDATANPETFTLAAAAYDITTSGTRNINHDLVEFYAGYTMLLH